MNEVITVFSNKEFGSVRSLMINGEPYFVGKDVANILGYRNGSRDVNRHVDEEDRQKIMVFDGNRDKEMIIINESGLYSLILSSKLPAAKKFQRWVTSEVLPSIRKTGGYGVNSEQLQAMVSEVVKKTLDGEFGAFLVDGVADKLQPMIENGFDYKKILDFIDQRAMVYMKKQAENFNELMGNFIKIFDYSKKGDDRWMSAINALTEVVAKEAKVTKNMVLSAVYTNMERNYGIKLTSYRSEYSKRMGRDVSMLETVRWLETTKRPDIKGVLKHILFVMVG